MKRVLRCYAKIQGDASPKDLWLKQRSHYSQRSSTRDEVNWCRARIDRKVSPTASRQNCSFMHTHCKRVMDVLGSNKGVVNGPKKSIKKCISEKYSKTLFLRSFHFIPRDPCKNELKLQEIFDKSFTNIETQSFSFQNLIHSSLKRVFVHVLFHTL